MKSRTWLAGLVGLVFPCTYAAGEEARPSLILIVADDLRWDALGCMGGPVVQTPNIDRLAARGVTFRNAFVTTSICAVSRASILSGQYARRHGIEDFATPFLDAAWSRTYPALLRSAGYYTGFIGKFGVGKDVAPMAAAFDVWHGLPGQGGPFFRPNDPKRQHATARFGDQALSFLRNAPSDRPFCLSLSFSAPHARDGEPREYPPDSRDEGLYVDEVFPVPRLATEAAYLRLPAFARGLEGRRRWERRFATPEMYQRVVRDYLRLITGVDREVGRILAELETLGRADRTVLVFTSDNGYILGERGMADKWLPYEESLRVPLIVADPGLPNERRGRTVEPEMALNIDLAPTLLELAGAAVPPEMQGRSLVPLVRGTRPPAGWRQDFFYEHHTFPDIIPPTEGVRAERWMYFRWTGADPVVEELYDLQSDPLEERNLVAEPGSAGVLETLRGRWAALRADLR